MKSEKFEEIRIQLATYFKELGVSKAILFGSTSRGSSTKRSDIDLLVVLDTDERFFDRYGAFEKIYTCFKGSCLDLLIYTPAELDRIGHRSFIKRILAEGQTIYEH